MNLNEAKRILQLCRPSTADAGDPQIAEALELAKRDQELAHWLELHYARQSAVSKKFHQIIVPAGLKEQIISEHAAKGRATLWRPRLALAAVVTALLLTVLGALGTFWFSRPSNDGTLAVFQNQMAGIALRGYGMDLTTNDPAQLRAYLARNKAPADYVLPAALQKAAVVGCAVEGWQAGKVSMICFRTGRPLPPGQSSDLWLFVVNRELLSDAPAAGETRYVTANRLSAAVWTEGGRVYLLGAEGSEAVVRQFL